MSDAYLPGSPLERQASEQTTDAHALHLRTMHKLASARAMERSAAAHDDDGDGDGDDDPHELVRQLSHHSSAHQLGRSTSAAGKAWGKARMLVRTSFAVSRDLHDLKAMVGSVSRSTTEEIEQQLLNEELKRQHCVIMPDTPLRHLWDGLQVVMLCYVALVVPFRISFDVLPELWSGVWWLELMVDVYFIFDVVLNFFAAYDDEEEPGKIVVERSRIRSRYLRSWFLMDLISVIPLNYYQQMVSSGGADTASKTKLFKILRMIRLAKLLRLARLQRLIKKYSLEVSHLVPRRVCCATAPS